MRDALATSRALAPQAGAAATAAGDVPIVIVCKSAAELEKMRAANQLVARVLDALRPLVVPGRDDRRRSTREAERLVRDAGAEPAFKGYRGFPATVCASVNHEVVHGIPGPRVLREGDILSLDMGVKLGGFYGDCAVTAAGRADRSRGRAAAGR